MAQGRAQTIFVHDRFLINPSFPNYPKLCAVNGANVAGDLIGVPPEIGFTARVALFKDGGKASFPALFFDNGRVISWRSSNGIVGDIRPTDRPKRAGEMKALVAAFESH